MIDSVYQAIMRLSSSTLALLAACVSSIAALAVDLDAVRAESVFAAHSKAGYRDEQCTLSTVSIRREWYVIGRPRKVRSDGLIGLQAHASGMDEERLHPGWAVFEEETSKNSDFTRAWRPKSLRRVSWSDHSWR